ncbi:hypothetical protein J2795_001345 [Chryseobacterium bernardetii]|jgi:hypothetical protein|uniref:Uncharacterized protein n=2 Tax=Chryseobacterium TaxID=59732 RepID=A0A543EJH9_9FLAO|nr:MULTISPECIES: hypothetical protein [Chryseobacterium]MDR6370112.1 hypothetical protein [Chryseobacterium vietnamense]MDR6440645.1 hypothetical protein [Chryseobacterium bernardetii]MDR6486848.1 hypothetical protein [Chryseobacterium vietnamense]TQM21672.1 hypothetical protein FB551_1364 [Chryseobacterium aquifrigidense]
MTNNFPVILTNEKGNGKKPEFRNALFNLDKSTISNDNVEHLITIYNSAKQLDIRNKVLKLLYDFTYPLLKDFFMNAYKKERYLDMKIYALRGLSNFIEEKEITQLLKKFNQSLAKRQQTTPYNFQEYELLKGGNALPYLAEKFGYPCFKETLEQVNRQYDAMPDAFKGHYRIDENGDIKMLKSPGESKAMMDRFWEEERSKLK